MSEDLRVRIKLDLDNSTMLNMFGLVNLKRLRDQVGVPKGITDVELRREVRNIFDHEVIGGVQFMKRK